MKRTTYDLWHKIASATEVLLFNYRPQIRYESVRFDFRWHLQIQDPRSIWNNFRKSEKRFQLCKALRLLLLSCHHPDCTTELLSVTVDVCDYSSIHWLLCRRYRFRIREHEHDGHHHPSVGCCFQLLQLITYCQNPLVQKHENHAASCSYWWSPYGGSDRSIPRLSRGS